MFVDAVQSRLPHANARTRRWASHRRLPCAPRVDQLIEAELDLFYRSALASFATRDHEKIFPTEQAAEFRANDLQVLHAGGNRIRRGDHSARPPYTSIALKVPLFSTDGNQGLASIGLT